MQISGTDYFLSLTPDATGFWVIEVSDFPAGRSYWISIGNPNLHLMESGSGRIELLLHEGTKYFVDVTVFGRGDDLDPFTVSASFVSEQELQPNSEMQLSGTNRHVRFVPNETGFLGHSYY